MSKITIKVDLEELKEAISQLSDDEREALFFELSPAWGKALQKMEQEAIGEDDEGKALSFRGCLSELRGKVKLGELQGNLES